MKTVTDFTKVKDLSEELETGKGSFDNVDLILEQLRVLLDAEGLEGLFFLKNRSPLMQQSPLGYITNYVGSEKFRRQLYFKEVFYSSFPRLRNISSNHDLAEIECDINSPVPLKFKTKKKLIVSAIKDDHYNWGMLICIGGQATHYNKRQLKLIESFSNLLSTTLSSQYQQKKKVFLAKRTQGIDTSKDKLIKKLQKTIEQKNSLLSSLKSRINSKLSFEDSKLLDLANKTETIDEVWLSVQGFKKEQKSPMVSRWEKICSNDRMKTIEKTLKPDSQNLLQAI